MTEIEPWGRATPPEVVHTTRIVGLETLRVAGACLLPFIPEAAARLLEALDGGSGLVQAPDVLAPSNTVASEPVKGTREMEAFWMRWNGRAIDGVKLF